MGSKIFISVVIPSYDEMANLQKGVLDHIRSYLEKKRNPYEVIVVDDGSTDGSREFIEDFVNENKNFRLIKNPHLGKAGSVTEGVLNAKGKYVLFTDMDQATPINQVDKLLSKLESGNFDIAIGSRAKVRKNAPLVRKFISLSNITLRKLIVGLSDITDTQCGFKLFTYKSSQDLFRSIKKINNNYQRIGSSSVSSGFDVELLYLATMRGYRITEVSVDWLYVETRRVNVFKDSWEGLYELFRIKKRAIRGMYAK